MEEVCANTVIFVNKCNTRNTVVSSLAPYGFGLRLNACYSVKNCNSTVQNTQATLYLGGKVYVTWGVDNLNNVIFPKTGSCSRGNGYTTLLLLNHPVHGCCTIVYLTNFVSFTCVIKNTLGCGGLTSIDMRHDTNVTKIFELILNFCHLCATFSRLEQ